MPYSLNELVSRAECDQLLDMAEDEKRTLLFRKNNLNYRVGTGADTAEETERDLLLVRAQLESMNIILNALPEGPEKKTQEAKKKRLEAREISLSSRNETYSAVARLDKEFDLERINRELEETDKFIAEVSARKAQLP
jgi:hypothetical protein